MRQALLTAITALSFAIAGDAVAACQVEQRGSVPVDDVNGHILVTVQVNESPATFILDTGAERTVMGEDWVRQFGLPRDSWVASALSGVGGITERRDALPRSLRLGSVTLRRDTLPGDTGVIVNPLPETEIAGQRIAGFLGRDFLAPFDLDLDLPARRMTLYHVSACGAGFLPWTTPYTAIPAAQTFSTALVIEVLVDGHPLRALVDSGASASLLIRPGISRLGLTRETLARDPGANGAGFGPAPVPMRQHRFNELRVGPEVTRDPLLWIASVRVVPTADFLLGADWLGSRRVWLSFATRQMFVMMR
jgi:hypothetical protein